MNPLKKDAATRTKEEIESIKHVYLDLDHGGSEALEAIENSSVVPKPNYVLNSSPEKHQIVWKIEGINLEEAEGLLHAMAREFGGDPAATDATRVLRVPGFANKKYDTNFYVEARRESTETYHLRDFKLHIDSQDSPRHDNRAKREPSPRTNLSQSEHDWAFAKRALARGDDPEEVIRQIAQHRAGDKSDPDYYARHTVEKAIAELKVPLSQPRTNSAADGQKTPEPGH
jgi:RepB DNA-primase from phage plasmid